MSLSKSRLSAILLGLMVLAAWPITRSQAQGFNSGSTGADGAFAPSASQAVQVPDSGVFNFTTVNVARGVTITFIRNTRNTPVTILATGNVTIAGVINVDGDGGTSNGSGGLGGVGGFTGGTGGFNDGSGGTGDGPGGAAGGARSTRGSGGGGGFAQPGAPGNGDSSPAAGGPRYGSRNLSPLIGGSGGGGGCGFASRTGGGGGGGGGAILIASSGTISFGESAGPGTISAKGGVGGAAA